MIAWNGSMDMAELAAVRRGRGRKARLLERRAHEGGTKLPAHRPERVRPHAPAFA